MAPTSPFQKQATLPRAPHQLSLLIDQAAVAFRTRCGEGVGEVLIPSCPETARNGSRRICSEVPCVAKRSQSSGQWNDRENPLDLILHPSTPNDGSTLFADMDLGPVVETRHDPKHFLPEVHLKGSQYSG